MLIRIALLRIAAVILAGLLLAPAALAADCPIAAPRNLHGDLAGVESVRIEVRGNRLQLKAGAGSGLTLSGRACATKRSALTAATVSQRRSGKQLVLALGSQGLPGLGAARAYLDVIVQLPASMPVIVEVGAGTADVSGMQQLQAQVGSGRLQARDIGRVSARVGSGSVTASGIGELEAARVGSGSFVASGVRGDVRIGNIASGVVRLRQVGGNVSVAALGSGTLEVDTVGGNFALGAKGSGKVTSAQVKGALDVPRG